MKNILDINIFFSSALALSFNEILIRQSLGISFLFYKFTRKLTFLPLINVQLI